MNFKIILKLVLGILIMTIGYYSYQMYVFAKGVQTDIKNGINHPRKEVVFSEIIKNGTWVSEKDSLASVRIHQYKWVFDYKHTIPDTSDIYSYEIKKINNSKSLTLTNQTDTLEYAIEYLSSESLSIIYLARGNIHNYKWIE
jgi:heme/copper-type cytochrome/quinol oxidase subunit 2